MTGGQSRGGENRERLWAPRGIPVRVPVVEARLFGPWFGHRLEILRGAARRLIREGRWRRLRERRRGRGQEFSDHRDYIPGDEIRHIDWNALARLDRAKVRVFEENERPPLTILLDRSASMEADLFREARRVAAGLAHVGLTHLGEVTLIPFTTTVEAGVGPLRGLGSFGKVLDLLESLRTGGETSIGSALRLASAGRRGVAVILSDLLQPSGWEVAIRRVRGHRLVLVHWVPLEPTVEGKAILRDRETGEVVERTLTPGARATYRRLWERESRRLEETCRRRGAAYLGARAGRAFDETVLEILRAIACDTP